MPPRTRPLMLLASVALLGALAVSLAGCGTTSTVECACFHKQPMQYPLFAARGDIPTLDPNRAGDSASRTVVSLLYDGLVTLDERQQVENWDAQKIDVSADGLTYTFHLRPRLTFADGAPITSASFAYSLNRALNPCLASPIAHDLFAIKDAATFATETCASGQIGLNAAAGQTGPIIATLLGSSLRMPNTDTLVVLLAQPAGDFLAALAASLTGALDPNVVGPNLTSEQWTDTLAKEPTGRGTSGMFMVRAWDHQSGKIVVVPSPHWWGVTQGKNSYLREVDFTVFNDASTVDAAYFAGQFDVNLEASLHPAPIKVLPNFRAVGTLSYNGLSLNWARPPFNNLDARQAFCLAVNRDLLNAEVLHDDVIPAWNIIPNGMPGFNSALTGPDGVAATNGDPVRVQRHWAAYQATAANAASPIIPPIAYLYDRDDPSAQAVAQTLQTQWQHALGITVALHGEGHAAWQRDVAAGNYTIAPLSATAEYPDPQQLLSRLFLDTTSAQLPDEPQADALMLQADTNINQKTRARLYQQAEQLLVENVVTCPLYQSQFFYQARLYLHNWWLNPMGFTPLDSWVNTFLSNH